MLILESTYGIRSTVFCLLVYYYFDVVPSWCFLRLPGASWNLLMLWTPLDASLCFQLLSVACWLLLSVYKIAITSIKKKNKKNVSLSAEAFAKISTVKKYCQLILHLLRDAEKHCYFLIKLYYLAQNIWVHHRGGFPFTCSSNDPPPFLPILGNCQDTWLLNQISLPENFWSGDDLPTIPLLFDFVQQNLFGRLFWKK